MSENAKQIFKNVKKLPEKITETRIKVASALPKVHTKRARLAIVGLSRVGKTVFITSLINHLLKHKPKRFALDKKKKLQIIRSSKCPASGDRVWNEFPYRRFRDSIAKGKWPEKTKDCYEYTLSFTCNTSLVTHYQLTLYDIPGERLADVGMVQHDYESWSHDMLELLRLFSDSPEENSSVSLEEKTTQDAIRNYWKLAESGPGAVKDPEELIAGYKRALVGVRNRGIEISPSIFLLDQKGSMIEEVAERIRERIGEPEQDVSEEYWKRLIGEIADARHSGLPEKEFCPLGEDWHSEEIAKEFARRYEEYREKIVRPLLDKLLSCDGIVVLVDLAQILQGGPDARNALGMFVEKLFEVIHPQSPLLSALGLRRQTRRVAVAAAQCDRFHSKDWDSLKKLTKAAFDDFVGGATITTEFYYCSAVQSTQDVGDHLKRIVGPGKKEYEVARVGYKDEWKDEWLAPQYFENIPEVPPYMPKVWDCAPDQINLNAIFGFVTRWFRKAPLSESANK